jgi:hypothetical protein
MMGNENDHMTHRNDSISFLRSLYQQTQKHFSLLGLRYEYGYGTVASVSAKLVIWAPKKRGFLTLLCCFARRSALVFFGLLI